MKVKPFYVVLMGVALFLFLIVYFVMKNFGSGYDLGISNIFPKTPEPPVARKARIVRKVTVIHEDERGCMEVTPDGVVRTYDTCGGELIDANRLSNPKNVLRLIQRASEIDLSKYRQKTSGPVITLIIETDTGTETVYIPIGDPDDDIEKTIDLIEGDLPQPTATPAPYTETPTPTLGGVSASPTPSPLYSPTPGPSPTPTPTLNPDQPFLCGYAQDGANKKPYNVSNFICSTQPSPAPTP